jgi:malate dehydrogenase
LITIIGAGRVGSEAAYNILEDQIGDVLLIDLQAQLAEGEALDMMQAAPAIEFDAKIVRSIVKEVAKYAPDCKLMIVTNPVDIMTYIARKESGLPKNRVFGFGNILDTMRFRSYIAAELGVSREDTHALVIGEHGDSMVPLSEFACVSGIPIADLMSKEQIEKMIRLTITSGADVIKLKGATVYAPAAAIALTAEAIVKDRKRVMSVSTCPSGEYGCSEYSIGVPVVLGKDGVEKILELNLSTESQERFDKSLTGIKEATTKLMA